MPAQIRRIDVDLPAAFPAQEPGTRPPVLSGCLKLSDELLAEGWINLFDGISTYGWQVVEGQGELLVKQVDGKAYLFLINNDTQQVTARHRLMNKVFITAKPNDPGSSGNGAGFHYHGASHTFHNKQGLPSPCTGKSESRVRPAEQHPLKQADWKTPGGDTKAVWLDENTVELTGGPGWLESVREYGDFVLQLEYKTDAPLNSGVFFRCIPGDKMNGYECQVFNHPPEGDYKKFIGTDTGGLFRRQVGRNVGPKDGQWNYLTIAVNGPKMATWVNGIQVTDWTDSRKEEANPRKGLRLAPGTIQLQGHDPTTKVQFRNFRISTAAW